MTTYLNAPETCDICSNSFGEVMFDAKTRSGPWGNLCVDCFNRYSVGLGAGLGQKYEKRRERWVKVDG